MCVCVCVQLSKSEHIKTRSGRRTRSTVEFPYMLVRKLVPVNIMIEGETHAGPYADRLRVVVTDLADGNVKCITTFPCMVFTVPGMIDFLRPRIFVPLHVPVNWYNGHGQLLNRRRGTCDSWVLEWMLNDQSDND